MSSASLRWSCIALPPTINLLIPPKPRRICFSDSQLSQWITGLHLPVQTSYLEPALVLTEDRNYSWLGCALTWTMGSGPGIEPGPAAPWNTC